LREGLDAGSNAKGGNEKCLDSKTKKEGGVEYNAPPEGGKEKGGFILIGRGVRGQGSYLKNETTEEEKRKEYRSKGGKRGPALGPCQGLCWGVLKNALAGQSGRPQRNQSGAGGEEVGQNVGEERTDRQKAKSTIWVKKIPSGAGRGKEAILKQFIIHLQRAMG